MQVTSAMEQLKFQKYWGGEKLSKNKDFPLGINGKYVQINFLKLLFPFKTNIFLLVSSSVKEVI